MIQKDSANLLGLLCKRCCILAMLLVPAVCAASQEAQYAASWGPEIGSALPLLEARDQSGQLRTLDDLTGAQGLLLLLSRSADW